MKRLTNDKVADNLKENIKGLQAIGYEPDMSNLRYVRLAEYERTGCTPEEIIAMQKMIITLKKMNIIVDTNEPKTMSDYAELAAEMSQQDFLKSLNK